MKLVIVNSILFAATIAGSPAIVETLPAASPPTVAPATAVPDDDRIRIAEARRLARLVGEKLWPGWSRAPFAVLLVTKDQEFLVHHPHPTSSFRHLGYDSLLQSDVYARDRRYETSLLATFPAVGGIPTIVIGQPKNTEASHSTRWVVTLLHEHFHQWQMSQPDYYSTVDGLGLANGDSTGMWMLNYPFPYQEKEVREAFEEFCRRLRDAVVGMRTPKYRDLLRAYSQAKTRLRDTLSSDDYAYLSFQLWQEGIARYTEYVVAQRAGAAYRPTENFETLPDYVSFASDAEQTRDHILNELMRMSLKKSGRMAFYYAGAAEGLLLDRENAGWRDRYFKDRFYVERYFKKMPSAQPVGEERGKN
ncbi:MAG: hypothetical protein OEN01_04625 [Candidatus Krumholzibacteria bacterium]|nr:hypothetical protein [Candidatus Krumholzibacteria bacterium]